MRTTTRDLVPRFALCLALGLAGRTAHGQMSPAPLLDPAFDEGDDAADDDEDDDGLPDEEDRTPLPRAPLSEQSIPFVVPSANQPSAVPHVGAASSLQLISTTTTNTTRSTLAPATLTRPASLPAKAGNPDDDALDFDPYAQRPVRAYLGASGGGAFVLGQSVTGEYVTHGGGFAIYGGFDLGHIFGLEVRYGGSFHGPAQACNPAFAFACDANYLVLQTLSLDARLRMPTGTRVTPFLQAGGTLAWIGREGFIIDAAGGGGEGGGGIEIWVTDNLTIDLRALYRGVKLGDFNHILGTSTFNDLLFTEMGFAFRF